MPTIIDSLMVTLGLDGSDFEKSAEESIEVQANLESKITKSVKKIDQEEKKLSEAEKKRAKEMEQRSKEIARGLNVIRNEALGLLALFTAGLGIKDFVKDTITSEASLSRMSQNLNMSAKDLAEWQLANVKAGGSAESMTNQLKESANDLARLKLGFGPSEAMQQFFRYGGSSKDLKDGNTYLQARADIIARLYKISPTEAFTAAKSMGIDEDTFNLLKQGSIEVAKLREAQSGLASELSGNSGKAEAFRQQMVQLMFAFKESSVNIVTAFMPALKGVASALKNVGDWLTAHKKDISEFITDGTEALKASSPFILGTLKLIAEGWKNIFEWGKKAGDVISGWLPESWKNNIGKFMAEIAAKGGSKEAAEALGINEGGKGVPRGIRNNNPGNIRYGNFAIQHGATGRDSAGFAIFPNMTSGKAALDSLLRGRGYLGGGLDTISKIISKYAPGNENNTSAYISAVSKQTGIGANQKLSMSDIGALSAAIIRHEEGAKYGAALAMAGMHVGAGMAIPGSVHTSNTSSSDVKIGAINIQTQAGDAAGIAKSIGGAITQYGFVPQANTGMS